MELNYYTEEYIADVITIEELRRIANSCSTCGVSWHEDHISLDCEECGGYSMSRPCASCDGKCGSIWRRNLELTHDKQKAYWDGECKLIKNSTNTPLKISCLISSKKNKAMSKTTNLSNSSFLPTGLKVS